MGFDMETRCFHIRLMKVLVHSLARLKFGKDLFILTGEVVHFPVHRSFHILNQITITMSARNPPIIKRWSFMLAVPVQLGVAAWLG